MTQNQLRRIYEWIPKHSSRYPADEMILEVAFLVVLLLIASLYAGYGGFPQTQQPKTDVEAFVSFRSEDGNDVTDEQATQYARDSRAAGKCPDDTTDLREERDKLLRRLTEVQQETHGDPENPAKASIRVGLERLIAEIERALEEEGRCVPHATAEAVVRASKRTFRPN